MRIATFGNCQASGIGRLLALSLPESFEAPVFFSNNRRTGRMESPDRIIAALTDVDLVIYQPLKPKYGPLSEAKLRESLGDSVTQITFPYIFNSGIAGLCRAANKAASGHSYGRIYGEETVIERLDAGVPTAEVVREYMTGELDFDLQRRFDECVERLATRERTTDIAVADFIVENYRSKRLFLTHNHPSTPLLAEICAQLRDLTGLPIDVEALRSSENLNLAGHAYSDVNCRISPHDLNRLGCTFDPDPDWTDVGPRLIEMIAREREGERAGERSPSERWAESARPRLTRS